MKRTTLVLILVASGCGWWLLSTSHAEPPAPATARPKDCPPTPMSKRKLLGSLRPDQPDQFGPLAERAREGKQRAKHDRLELDLPGMLKEAAAIRRDVIAKTPAWTDDRRQRATEEHAVDVITSFDQIVANRSAAVALGKAFFWEMRVGSDGQTACASCHFHAGADTKPLSWGVVQRLMGQGAPDKHGTDPSVEFNPDAALNSFRNQWGGMINFNEFLIRMATKALKTTQAELKPHLSELSEDQRQQLQRELVKLKADAWPTVKLAQSELQPLLAQQKPQKQTRPNPNEPMLQKLVERSQDLIETATSLVNYVAGDKTDPTKPAAATDDKAAPRDRRFLKMLFPRELKNYQKRGQAAQQPTDLKDQPQVQPPAAPAYLRQLTTGRNAPTVINAALNDRLFHDGRAASVFNGYDHLGDDAGPDGVGKWMCFNDGFLRRVLIRVPHSALASQGTAPVLSAVEMSWFGRQYHHLARKLLPATVLDMQNVSQTDSALGAYASVSGQGLKLTYEQLIQRAFRPQWWSRGKVFPIAERDSVTGHPLDLTQTEANFSLFWGVALQLYQESLISDQSPFDKTASAWKAGKPAPADGMSDDAIKGLTVFREHACADCHRLPEFAGGTFASTFGPMLEFEGPLDAVNEDDTNGFVDWLRKRDGHQWNDERVEAMNFRPNLAPKIYDNGYYNIEVTTDDPWGIDFDPGNGGELRIDPHNPLLSTRQRFGSGLPTGLLERHPALPFSLARRYDDSRSVTRGAFKTATLRNVELTKPYFHNGNTDSLAGVLEHYDDPTIDGKENAFLHLALLLPSTPDVKPRRETSVPNGEMRKQVEALLRSLTDPRVQQATGPFDHPSLRVPTAQDVDPKTWRTMESKMELISP